jgi:hypothetical protein
MMTHSTLTPKHNPKTEERKRLFGFGLIEEIRSFKKGMKTLQHELERDKPVFDLTKGDPPINHEVEGVVLESVDEAHSRLENLSSSWNRLQTKMMLTVVGLSVPGAVLMFFSKEGKNLLPSIGSAIFTATAFTLMVVTQVLEHKMSSLKERFYSSADSVFKDVINKPQKENSGLN